MATARTTLRRTVGDRLGDMVILKATHASGSADTFKDTIRLGDRGDNAPSLVNKIAYLVLAASPNQGHEARITEYLSEERTLTFSPAAPSTPAVDDELELWSTTERIGSIDTLNRHFNAAIRAVSDEVGVEVWTDAETFNARSPSLSIPDTWVEFGGADWADPGGNLHEIPSDRMVVRPGIRTVTIEPRTRYRANRRSVRLWGYAGADEMTADSGDGGTTTVNAEWLVETVLGWIAIAASAKASDIRGPAEERRGSYFSQQAMQYRRNVATARRGLGITL